MKRVSVRAALIAAIARDVTELVKRDRFHELEMVMELTGYMSNRSWSTSHRMGRAIIALSAVLERSWLESTAHGASFYCHFSGKLDWHRANARGDRTLRDAGIDIDARNAKEAREEKKARAKRAARKNRDRRSL
jgi:hypothetical protein